jgi:hypothetical protein
MNNLEAMVRRLVLSMLLLLPSLALSQTDEVESDENAWQNQPPPPPPPPEQGDVGSQSEALPPTGAPSGNMTQEDFENALSSYGRWVDVPGMGRGWVPWETVVGSDFVPYSTGGDWTYTPSGWEFQSQWPFGWATFHYGRWIQSPSYGWIWLPGYRWAPAWVDWRYNDGYVAWAPLAPPGYGVAFAYSGPVWSFVHRYYFGRRGMNQYLVPPAYRRGPGWWHQAYVPPGVRAPPVRPGWGGPGPGGHVASPPLRQGPTPARPSNHSASPNGGGRPR